MVTRNPFSDKYSRSYYSISPKVDPTGPSQGTKSRFEYQLTVPRSGKYSLTAQVVTANYNQRLNVSANDAESEIAMEMPFTVEFMKPHKIRLEFTMQGMTAIQAFDGEIGWSVLKAITLAGPSRKPWAIWQPRRISQSSCRSFSTPPAEVSSSSSPAPTPGTNRVEKIPRTKGPDCGTKSIRKEAVVKVRRNAVTSRRC